MTVLGKVKVITQSYFAMEIPESARHLSGNQNYSPGRKEKETALTSCDVSSLVVDRLCDQARGQSSAVTCFYVDFADRKEQSATSILGSLLRQIVGGLERIPEEISQAFQEEKNAIGGRGPRHLDIVKMLQAITSSLRTFICIDALDECAALDRAKLLNSLEQILEKSPGTRIFIIGRPHIRAEIESLLEGRVTSVSVSPRKDDIIGYLRVRLGQDLTPHAMNKRLEADILEKIPKNMSEMYVGAIVLGAPPSLSANLYSRFLLVSLTIDAVLHESTIHRRREKLNKMTLGLQAGDIYSATVERIKGQDGDQSTLGMAALMWISHAERPLRADELCHALAVELGSTDFNVDNIPLITTLVSCCQGLITIDREASTVRLIHLTLHEYLSAHLDIFNSPHSAMAEICLTHLNSQQVKALSTAPFPSLQDTPFLEYCSVYWGVHAKRELSQNARSIALELLKEHYSQISTKFLFAHAYVHFGDHDTCPPFNGLHCASFFGIFGVVDGLIEAGGYDINKQDFWGCTPLSWAACNGHEEVVKFLLGRREIDPDKPNGDGQTPLFPAAWNGHEGTVKILLEQRDVSPDKPDNNGRTPLSYSAWSGREGVVKMLLQQKEVNPNKPDNEGRTPLSYAAWYECEGVVKVLLAREEVSPDKPDKYGRTPLSFAAQYGREGVVEMLLGRKEVNPDKTDDSGQTPLSFAALYGREGVVKILLAREEVNADRPNKYGRTPLSYAAWYGHEGVVKILLGREEVKHRRPDNDCHTPLWYAAQCGHDGVVELLRFAKR